MISINLYIFQCKKKEKKRRGPDVKKFPSVKGLVRLKLKAQKLFV